MTSPQLPVPREPWSRDQWIALATGGGVPALLYVLGNQSLLDWIALRLGATMAELAAALPLVGAAMSIGTCMWMLGRWRAESRASGAKIAALTRRAEEADARVDTAERPERAIASKAAAAVRCFVGGIHAGADGRVVLMVWIENRLRNTPIRLEDVVVKPVIRVPGRELPLHALSDVQRNVQSQVLQALDERVFPCLVYVPEVEPVCRDGRRMVRFVNVVGVEGYCVVSGPWGERHNVEVMARPAQLVMIPNAPESEIDDDARP